RSRLPVHARQVEGRREADSDAVAHQVVLRIASGTGTLSPEDQFCEEFQRALAADLPVPAVQTELNPTPMSGYAGTQDEEGVAEYELWMKPTPAYPDGFVMRVAGDAQPVVLHLEDSEGLPGKLPYHDSKGNPLWTFHHASYEHVGGRVLGSSALDPAIPKFDQLNRLDSIVEMMMTRLAIPQIIKPKGQEISWLGDSPAMPGLIAEYAPAPGGG